MLHACCSLLTGTQAEGRREGPRPVGIEAVQLHRRVGEIACAHAARDGPRGRTPGAGPVGSRGVERRRLLLSARPVARSMAARRAVAILVSGSRAAGHAPPRSTPSRRHAVTPRVYRPRGLDGCVATFKKRPENSWSSRPGSVSCSHFEQLVDELNLLPNIRTVQAPRLPLPDHVHGLVSLDRSPRRVEFTKALLGRHASFDRAPSCAGSPAGRWSPRR